MSRFYSTQALHLLLGSTPQDVLYVPRSKACYQVIEDWSDFQRIEEMDVEDMPKE